MKFDYEYSMELDEYRKKPESRLPKRMPARGWHRLKVGKIAKIGDVLCSPQSGDLAHYLAMSFGEPIKSDWTPLYRKFQKP